MKLSSGMVALASLALGLVVGYGGAHYLSFVDDTDSQYVRSGGYKFINPLISCELNENTYHTEFNPLRTTFASDIQKATTAGGGVTRVGVYFRELDHGYWTGVGEDQTFILASLAKVPVLITLLQQTKTEPDLLTATHTLTASDVSQTLEHYASTKTLTVGETYTNQDLMDRMITESDNTALNAVSLVASTTVLADVYSNFTVPPPDNPDSMSITPKLYSHFFRVLYNGSYLGRVRSVQALELLSKTTFADGLVQGVPTGTTVSHKFGERSITNPDGTTLDQLHDCGIVYYPAHPYLLCVMTEGTDFNALSATIGTLSKDAYDAVSGGLFDSIKDDN